MVKLTKKIIFYVIVNIEEVKIMKRKFKGLMLGVLCLVMLFMLTGCLNKTAITSSDFKTKMEEKEYKIEDITSDYSEYDFISKYYIALNYDSSIQIDFLEFSSTDTAVYYYNMNKEQVKNSISSNYKGRETTAVNYAKYTLTADGAFTVISIIDNTIIYIEVPENYKSDVQDVLKDLGY